MLELDKRSHHICLTLAAFDPGMKLYSVNLLNWFAAWTWTRPVRRTKRKRKMRKSMSSFRFVQAYLIKLKKKNLI